MIPFRRIAALSLVVLSVLEIRADSPESPPTPEELAARERIRPQAEATLAWLRSEDRAADEVEFAFDRAVRELVALGPPVGAFMIAEVDLPDASTFNIAAYVLGLVPSPEGGRALWRALAAADEEGGGYGRARKEWAAYGLAVMGEAAVIDHLAGGKTDCAWMELYADTRLIDVAAALNPEASVGLLAKQTERYAADESKFRELAFAVDALGWTREAAAVAVLTPFARHPDVRVRGNAISALGRVGSPASLDTIFAALDDPVPAVRSAAAVAISELLPPDRQTQIMAQLEKQTDSAIRGHLYGTLAAGGGDTVVEALRNHWSAGDELDRITLISALGRVGSRKALPFLRAAVQEPSTGIPIAAVRAIRQIPGDGAVDTLIALVHDPRWPVAQTAIEQLVELREKRAAPRIAGRLLQIELAERIISFLRRDPVRLLTNALVDFRYTEVLDDLRKAASRQTEPTIVEALQSGIQRLGALATHGNDAGAWSELARSEDPPMRQLAWERLAEIGSATAVSTLDSTLPGLDARESTNLFLAISAHPSAAMAPIIERVLLEPQYDGQRWNGTRAMAAWAARRLGGDRMTSALRKAAARRSGQDYYVLVAYAQLAGKAAVPVLREHRLQRLRHFGWFRGREALRLDSIVRLLESDRPIDAFDEVPPDDAHVD